MITLYPQVKKILNKVPVTAPWGKLPKAPDKIQIVKQISIKKPILDSVFSSQKILSLTLI